MNKLVTTILLLTLTLFMQSAVAEDVKRHGSFIIHSVAEGDFAELAEIKHALS